MSDEVVKEFYKVIYTITIDGYKEYRKENVSWILRESTPKGSLYFLKNSNYKDIPLKGIYLYGESFFRHRPYIRLKYFFNDSPRYYLDKHDITVESDWQVADNLSLNGIIEHASAQDAIEYLKERGMAACPFNQGE